MVYDSDNNLPKVNVNGSWQTINTGSGPITFPITIAQGGTGQITQQLAINALAGTATSTYYLRGNGTNVAMSAIQASDVPTLNQSTTGTATYATNVASGIANDIPYQTATGVTSFIAPVNSAVLVSSSGGVPSMSTTLPAISISSGTVTDPTTSSTASINTALSNINSAIPSVSYPIAVNKGGTGKITQADAITNLTGAQTSGYYLRSDGTNSALAAISAADVPTLNQSTSGTAANVTGVVALAHGGTEANLTASNGGIFYSTGSAGAILSGTATANKLLLSGASTTPAWSTSTYPGTNAANTLLYASSANTMAALTTANSGVLVTSSTGVPSILSTGTTGQFLSASTAGTPAWSTSTYPGTNAANTLLYASSANTMAALTTANSGVLVTSSAGVPSILSAGTTGQFLNASTSGTPAWSTATYPATTTANQILYSSAANVVGGLTTGNDSVLITSAAGVPSLSTTLPAVTAGAVLVTDPTTSSSASVNTALANVLSYHPLTTSFAGAAASGVTLTANVTGPQYITGTSLTLTAGTYLIMFTVNANATVSAGGPGFQVNVGIGNTTTSTYVLGAYAFLAVGSLAAAGNSFGGNGSGSKVITLTTTTTFQLYASINTTYAFSFNVPAMTGCPAYINAIRLN